MIPLKFTRDRFDFLLVPLLGVALLVRVLADDQSAPNSRHSGTLNLSAAIAALFILVAIGSLLRRHRGVRSTIIAVLWLGIWTVVAVHTRGSSAETIREGVREGSVIALAVVIYSAPGTVTISIATRLVQFVGFAPAILALYQLATHTGMEVAGNLRSHGTFVHPNIAATFFAIAATVSLWQYLDNGRRWPDVLLMTLFAAALIATFSIDGLATMCFMLVVFGAMHPGSWRTKVGPCIVAGIVLLAFFATPLGSRRIAKESSTSLVTAERGEANSTLGWRLNKWKTLLPEWEQSPILGRGLGTTTTETSVPADEYAGALPHNEYLRYLVETGVLGLGILLWALVFLVRILLRRRRIPSTLDNGTSNAATLAIVIVGGCLVDSLADNTLLNSPICYAAALIVVAVLGSPELVMNDRRRSELRL